MTFDRYRDVIPDWSAFRTALDTPEAPTLRIRSGATTPGDVGDRLRRLGFRLAPIEGLDDFFRVEGGPGSVAQTLEHWLGLFHVQQAAMALPSLALGPRPGERVLDLCAAPGGKTAHLAELMQDHGPLVAVDPKEKRLRGLLGNLYRLGHPNVLVVAADGRALPDSARFDRVLVDAPCSAEGNVRRQSGRRPRRTAAFVRYATSLQEALLRRGIQLARPGGVVAYSTCTFAPEENEAVLDRVTRDAPVRLEKIPLSLPHDPGLTEWEGDRFSPDMALAWRVYPHHLDSGGLFMARLRRLEDDGSEPSTDAPRTGDPPPTGAGTRRNGFAMAQSDAPPPLSSSPDGWTPAPEGFPGEDLDEAQTRIRAAKAELQTRYGMDAGALGALGWLVRKENIWAHTAGHWPVDAWSKASESGRWRVMSLGIRALRRDASERETPSSHFLSRWGHQLSEQRRVELDRDGLRTLLDGERLPAGTLPTGPVALLWDGKVVGRGMVGRLGLSHEIGRSYAERLRAILG